MSAQANNTSVTGEVFSVEKLLVLIKAANKAAESITKTCRAVADYLVKDQNTSKPTKDEHKRLMGLCDTAERNARLYIAASLWIAMVPDAEIETGTQGRGDKKSRTLKPAAQCSTAREVTAAAKQIRELEGASDKRATNAPAKKALLPAQFKTALANHSPDVQAIIALLRGAGYKITAPKSTLGADLAKLAK